MFIKVTKSKNYHYLQLVESYREDGKNKHKVHANLGRFDQLEGNKTLVSLGQRLLRIAGAAPKPSLEIEERGRLYYGHIVYQKIWEKFKLNGLLASVASSYRIRYDLGAVIFYLVIHRLLIGGSKHKCYEEQKNFYGLEQHLDLQHIYRSLDILASHKATLERQLFDKQRHLFKMKVDVVFYDLTTFHFESNLADDLRNFGYSKTGHFNEVQVVMGLLVDKEGRPIGYELFEGNMSETKTVIEMLKRLKERFSIGKVVFVADRGLNSGYNLKEIKAAGYEYIVGCRIKNQSKKVEGEIFSAKGYVQGATCEETGKVLFKYKIIDNHAVNYKDGEGKKQKMTDQLLITWSEKRRRRDEYKRNRLIDKAKEMIEKGQKISGKKGAKKYLKTMGEQKVKGLDEQKIQKDKKWDGYYAIQFSQPEASAMEIQSAYHTLWRIEESFKVLKSTMKTRPIFHWTPQRIRGHFMVCFLAFLIERHLEYELKKNKIDNASPETIKEALKSLQLSEIQINNEHYYLKGKHNDLAAKILRILKIKQPKNLTPMAKRVF